MKTDQLIAALAANAAPVQPTRSLHALVWAAAAGALVALLLLVGTVGLNPVLRLQAAALPMFWVKFVFVTGTAWLGLALVRRLAQPGRRAGAFGWLPALPAAGVWLLALLALSSATPGERGVLWLGSTWLACPFLIGAYALPSFILLMLALRSLAPTRLRLAGTAAGLAAGAVGASVYQLHCPELAAPFLGTWYVLGILAPAAIGALIGPRMLRW